MRTSLDDDDALGVLMSRVQQTLNVSGTIADGRDGC
jgi:hypothetical protein